MQFKHSRLARAAIAAAALLAFPALAQTNKYVTLKIDYRDPVTDAVAVYTWVAGVNSKGQAVGQAVMNGGNSEFNFIYTPSTGFTPVAQPPGFDGVNSLAILASINDVGVMAGITFEANGQRGFTLTRDALGDTYSFFTVPGSLETEGRTMGNPTPEHPQGLVVGFSDTTPGAVLDASAAYIYDPATSAFATFSTPNSYQTTAQGINAAGQIVGNVNYRNGSGSPLANGQWSFLFTPSTGTDPMLGGSLSYFRVKGAPTRARGISGTGLIAAGTFEDDYAHTYVVSSAGYQEIVMPEAVGTNCPIAFGSGSAPQGMSSVGHVSGPYIDASCNVHGFIATPVSTPTGTTSNGAYTFNVDVVANTPIFIDPPVALSYEYKTGAADPLFATVRLPLGIGDNKFRVVLRSGESFRVNAGELFDFRTHGYPAGTNSFQVRCIDPRAMLDPANSSAFPTELTFAGPGKFRGTQQPSSRFIPSAAAAAQTLVHQQCLRGED